MQFFIKIIVTAFVVGLVSELAKRVPAVAAVMASLPLTSMLAFIWLYHDTEDSEKVINLSYSIFWMVLPSLLFFIVLPMFLKQGVRFSIALVCSSIIMAAFYFLFIYLLGRIGVKL